MTVSKCDRGVHGREDLPEKADGRKWNRNTLYEDDYIDIVVQLGKQGASYAEMCAALEVSKKTVDSWRRDMQHFDDACLAALTASEAYRNAQGAQAIEWVNAKGELQFRSEIWKELKSEHRPTEKIEIKSDAISDAAQAVHDETQKYLDRLHKETI